MLNQFNPAEKTGEKITVNFPLEQVYQAVIKVVNNTKGFKLDSENKILNRITLKTGASLFSWGELMTVQLTSVGKQTEITVLSELKTAIGSQGIGAQATIGKKNKKNIDNLLNEMSKYL